MLRIPCGTFSVSRLYLALCLRRCFLPSCLTLFYVASLLVATPAARAKYIHSQSSVEGACDVGLSGVYARGKQLRRVLAKCYTLLIPLHVSTHLVHVPSSTI